MSKRPRRHGLCKCGEVARPAQRNCKACHCAAMRKHRGLNPLTPEQRKKDTARSYAKMMLVRGVIQREPCLLCGADAQMHHPDYERPRFVLWLCRDHHLDLHAGRVVLLEYMQQPTVKPPRKIKFRSDPRPEPTIAPLKCAA